MKSKKINSQQLVFACYGFTLPLEYPIVADGDREILCEHGVGHGPHIHGCDGKECCKKACAELKRRKCGKKQQRTKRANSKSNRSSSKKAN